MKIRINNVRLAFPALFEPKAVNAGDKPSFSAAFIVPKNHPQIAEIEKALATTADEKWGVKGPTMLKTLKAWSQPLRKLHGWTKLDSVNSSLHHGKLFSVVLRYTVGVHSLPRLRTILAGSRSKSTTGGSLATRIMK